MERMALEKPFGSQNCSLDKAVSLNCFVGVGRARRIKAAVIPKEWRYKQLV